MTVTDIIDAINERAVMDAEFRLQLESAIASGSKQGIQRLMTTVFSVADETLIGRPEFEQAIHWFLDHH